MYRRTVRLLLTSTAVAAASLAVAPVAGAQGSTSTWAPWIGCWDLVPRASAGETSSDRVCVIPTESPAVVELVSVVGDSITSRQRLDASADDRALQQGECSGMENVQATGARVYLRTTLRCGEEHRLVNSVMAMSADGEWLDVRGVAFGSNVGVRASRYRAAPSSARLPAEVASALRGEPSGMHAARVAASGPVQLSDVVEAARFLEVGVLQTWLAERGQGFGLDAQRLVALEEAGVAPAVIDVMVALSYPQVFALDRTQLGDPPPDVRGDFRGDDFDRGGYYGGGFGYDPYGYDPYGYGYGRGNGWYSGRRPIVVVQRPADGGDAEGGKVVKGRGYVAPRGGSGGSGNSSSGRSGTAGRASSDSEKGSSTGRKAKPKPKP
jgi:hypothetical protein